MEMIHPGGYFPADETADGPRAALNRAIALALEGESDAAVRALEEAERALADGGDEHGRVRAGASRAWAHVRRGELREGWAAASDALRRARRNKDEHGTAIGLMATALVDHARGSSAEARSRLGDASRRFERCGDVLRQVQCRHLLGEIAYEGEDPIRAGSLYREGMALARKAGHQDAVDLLTLLFEHR